MKKEFDYWQKLYANTNAEEKRLHKCQAWYKELWDGTIMLKSYNTVVAVYDVWTDTLVSLGRFSNTTYQHVRKFRNDICPNGYNTKEQNLELVNWYK